MTGEARRDGIRRRVGIGAVVVVAALVLVTAPAEAHATLVSTSPEAGAVLDAPPDEVRVRFDEPVETDADSLRVIDASGTTVSGAPEIDGSTVRVAVESDAEGWFAVSWQVVSGDGHPLTGGWTYRVGAGADAAPDDLLDLARGQDVSSAARIEWGVTQWASSLAALALAGAAFVVLVTPAVASQRRLVAVLTLVGTITSALAAGLNGPATTPDGAWFDGPATPYYLARTAALAVGGVALWATWRPRWATVRLPAAALLVVGLCVTVLSGHARSDGTTTVVLVMAHLVVAGAWLGALPAVLLGAWHGGDSARTTLATFSRAAVWLAGAVVLLGVVAAWILSGGLESVAPRWGNLLFVKVGLVVVAVLAGGWTRVNVLREWSSRTRREIRAPLLVEVGLLALIAALAVALTHNGPPESYVDDGPVQVAIEQDDVVVTLVIDPGLVGTNDLHLYVTDPSGQPLDVEEATVQLSSADLGIAPIEQTLSDLAGGHYSGDTDDLGAPGTWEVRVVVRPTPFTQVVLEETIELS
jgi:copper transport protein